MRLKIVTPLEIIVDDEDVQSLRAEDLSGSFGVLPGHAEFLTSLAISVISWTDASENQHFCAVRGGVLTVTGGQAIAVATREAVTGDDLASLDQTVLARFRQEIEEERSEHVEATRLQLNAVRRLVSRLHPRHDQGMMS